MDKQAPPDDAWHWQFDGSHVLIAAIRLDSFAGLFWASLLTVALCLAERALTFQWERRSSPAFVRTSRWRWACWRGAMYWVVTFLRLSYMLVAMSFNIVLLLIMLSTLAFGQLLIELRSHHPPDYSSVDQSFLELPHEHTRSKPKPNSIYIHPNQSNVARADAVALELGLAPNGHHPNVYGTNSRQALLNPGRDSHQFDLGEDSDSDS